MIGDRKIGALLDVETAGVRLPDDLLDKIKREASKPQPRRRWFRTAFAGLAASVLLLMSLPGARAVATDAIRQMFNIGGVDFVVDSGSDPAPQMGAPESEELNPKPDSDNRYFYTSAGSLPSEGIAAVKSLGEQFLIPAWLPEEMPKRLQLPLGGIDGINYSSPYTLAIGTQMTVSARYPGWGKLQFQGGTAKVDAKPVVMGGAKGMEVIYGNQTSYYLTVNNVGYILRGPTTEAAVLRKIAESLAPQGQ